MTNQLEVPTMLHPTWITTCKEKLDKQVKKRSCKLQPNDFSNLLRFRVVLILNLKFQDIPYKQ